MTEFLSIAPIVVRVILSLGLLFVLAKMVESFLEW
jgi:hypothetical protein